jgi:16S rRNA (cytidine1402-2'-O)-methyltransferase
MPPGSLYLVPVSLGESRTDTILPEGVQRITRGLRYFIVENPKSARAELKKIGLARSLRQLDIRQLPRRPSLSEIDELLSPLDQGESAGLMSEAGVPAVADPGALVVRTAHVKGIRVVPLVGPSSLLLALMASGLDGQRFAFHGYLPVREPDRSKCIMELEQESRLRRRTQIFIETPYRNATLFTALLDTCRSDTLLCVATELTTNAERIVTKSIDAWRKGPSPALRDKPAVFLLMAG